MMDVNQLKTWARFASELSSPRQAKCLKRELNGAQAFSLRDTRRIGAS